MVATCKTSLAAPLPRPAWVSSDSPTPGLVLSPTPDGAHHLQIIPSPVGGGRGQHLRPRPLGGPSKVGVP